MIRGMIETRDNNDEETVASHLGDTLVGPSSREEAEFRTDVGKLCASELPIHQLRIAYFHLWLE